MRKVFLVVTEGTSAEDGPCLDFWKVTVTEGHVREEVFDRVPVKEKTMKAVRALLARLTED
jgi:hypothetical protein